jgi:hypothetical protein
VRLSGGRLLVVLFVLTLPLVTPRIRGADEIQYYSHLRSLVFDGDLDFENEYRWFVAQDPQGLLAFQETFLERREPLTGRPINFTPIGCALLWSPFYLLAHVVVLALRGLGASIAADGFSRPYQAAVCYASALYGFAGLLLLHAVLRRRFAEPTAAWAVAAIWLASPLVYYMTLAPGFSHANSVFAVSLLLWSSLRAREQPTTGRFVLVGLAAGLCGLIREQDVLFVAIPAGLLLWSVLREGRPTHALLRLLLLGGVAAAFLAAQLPVYHALNGRFRPTTLVTRKLSLSSPHFLDVLVDPEHGLFLWSPLLALAAAGLVYEVWRRREILAGLLLLALLLQVWINGAVLSWHQAGAFGSRRFVASSAIFAFGLAALLEAFSARRALLAASLLFFVWWNVSLMVQFGLKLMDRQRLEWPKVARNQFTEVPRRLGRTALLFFSDRERLLRETR